MSITAKMPQLQEIIHQRRRNGSGELDVFEAAGYFSSANEIYGTNFTEQKRMMRSSGRISPDINPTIRNSTPAPTHHQKAVKDNIKYKQQPNSPGAKLASFLNSLFNQTSSKKKKSKTASTQSMKDDQDREIGRRKRRSSISHFPSANTTTLSNSSDSKKSLSLYSSSSQFKKVTPPAKNPLKDVDGNNSVQNPVNDNVGIESSSLHKEVVYNQEKNINTEKYYRSHGEKLKFGTKYNSFGNGVWSVDYSEDGADLRKFIIKDENDGADSDSSSDLFELQNYDLLSCYLSDLPVYETTHMNSIKRGAPIG